MLRNIRAFLALVALVIPVSSHAGDVKWTGATDPMWDNPANWSPTGVPTSGDTAIFGESPTMNMDIELVQPSYTLTGLVFEDSGFSLQNSATSSITITGGAISSISAQFASNIIGPTLVMTAVDNIITVGGSGDHELELGDLDVTGTFTANVVSSLCLGGTTTITGAFVKSGVGEICTENGLAAESTSVQNGNFMVEGDSSLGNVVVSSAGSIAVTAGAAASAHSISIAGVVGIGLFGDNGEILIADQGATVLNGGVLAGLGTIQGNTTVQAGGELAPGGIYEIGSLTIKGDVDLQINSITIFTIFAPNDLVGSLSITGNLTLQGILSLNDTAEAGLYTLIDFTGGRTGTFSGLQDTVDGYYYDLIYNSNSVQLAVTAVPEPGEWGAIMGVGLLGLALLRRTRQTAI